MLSPALFSTITVEKRILFFRARVSFGADWQYEQAKTLLGAGLTEEQAASAVITIMREVRRVLERI